MERSDLGARISRRSFLRLAGLVAAAASLPGCVPVPPEPTPRVGTKAQLVYQDWRTDWFPPMAQRMLEEFHAANPNIRVFYAPDPENEVYAEKMLADLQAGRAADVFQGCCTHFPTWAQKGYTLDLRPFVSDLDRGTVDDWNPAQYRSFFTRDGRQFGLPKYHGGLALYYNKDIFDRYGVAYPDGSWNHDDYLVAMKRLTRSGVDEGQPNLWGSMLEASWDRIQVHVNAWGGHFVDQADPTRCQMADPPAMAALEWLRARAWDDRVMPTALSLEKSRPPDAFAAGRLAMVEDGSWALKAILVGSNFRVGVAPFPAGPARRATLATTDGFGIYSGTREPEAAWELVKFLVSKQYGRAMAQANFLQPARASLVEDWVDYVRQEFPTRARDTDIAAFADGHLKGYSVTAEVFANMDEARRLADAAWDQILTLGQAPVQLMERVCRQIQDTQKTAGGGDNTCCQPLAS